MGLPGTLQSLSPEVLCRALSWATWEDLLRMERVCKQLRKDSSTEPCWLALWQEMYPTPLFPDVRQAVVQTLVPEHLEVGQGNRYKPGTWRDELLGDQRMLSLKPRQRFTEEDEVWYAKWSFDGRMLLTASRDSSWAVYVLHKVSDPDNPSSLLLKEHASGSFGVSEGVAVVAWSPDSERFLVSCKNNDLHCYNVVKGAWADKVIHVEASDSCCEWIDPLHFLAGTNIPYPHLRQTVTVFRIDPGTETLQELREISVGMPSNTWPHYMQLLSDHSGGVHGVFLCTTDLYSGQCNCIGSVNLAPLAEGKPSGAPLIGYAEAKACGVAGGTLSLDVTPNHRYVLINIRPFRVDSRGKRLPAGPNGDVPLSHTFSLALLDAHSVISGSNGDAAPRPQDTQLLPPPLSLVKEYTGHKGFSPDSSPFNCWPSIGVFSPHIATGSEDALIYIYNLNYEKLVAVLRGHSDLVNAVAWHPKLPRVMASSSDDASIVLWAASDGGKYEDPAAQEFFNSLPLM